MSVEQSASAKTAIIPYTSLSTSANSNLEKLTIEGGLFEHLLSFLSIEDVLNLCITRKEYAHILDKKQFWKNRLISEFKPDQDSTDPKTTYYEMTNKTDEYIINHLCTVGIKEPIIDSPPWCIIPPKIKPFHFSEAFKRWHGKDPKRIVLSRLEKKLLIFQKSYGSKQ